MPERSPGQVASRLWLAEPVARTPEAGSRCRHERRGSILAMATFPLTAVAPAKACTQFALAPLPASILAALEALVPTTLPVVQPPPQTPPTLSKVTIGDANGLLGSPMCSKARISASSRPSSRSRRATPRPRRRSIPHSTRRPAAAATSRLSRTARAGADRSSWWAAAAGRRHRAGRTASGCRASAVMRNHLPR